MMLLIACRQVSDDVFYNKGKRLWSEQILKGAQNFLFKQGSVWDRKVPIRWKLALADEVIFN
jgi:hypothetical protein